jgi:hypothetical protein
VWVTGAAFASWSRVHVVLVAIVAQTALVPPRDAVRDCAVGGTRDGGL